MKDGMKTYGRGRLSLWLSRETSIRRMDLRRSLVLLVLLTGMSVAASGQISVSGRLTHEFEVEPGGTYEGEIVVTNTRDVSTGVEIEQFDYAFFADGSTVYGRPGTQSRSNASWITVLSPTRVFMGPGGALTVRYRMEVPDDASLSGTHWSLVTVTPLVDRVETPAPGELAIRQVLRYAIQVVANVGDTGERSVRVVAAGLVGEDEGVALRLGIENDGERVVAPQVWAELYGGQGESAGRLEGGKLRIYPGCSVEHRILLSGLESGEYKALVIMDNGDEYVWGAQYDLEL